MCLRKIKCYGALNMERRMARLQELYTHVEFVSYRNNVLTIAYES